MSKARPNSPKTIVITGAARGIGLATAARLVAAGNRLAISDIDGDLAEAEAIKLGSQAKGYQLDVTDREAFKQHLVAVEDDLGPIDVLINNAGIASASTDILAQDPVITDRTIDINLKGTMNGTIAALDLMVPRGRGQVVNIASLAGILGVPGLAAYAASKFGVVGFTESVRMEFGDKGIAFTCVMPGPVATQMMDGTSSSPLVSMLTPDEMAQGIVDAIDSAKPRISLPKSSWLLARLTSVLPAGFGIKLSRWTRIDRIYTDVDPGARAEYEERIQP